MTYGFSILLHFLTYICNIVQTRGCTIDGGGFPSRLAWVFQDNGGSWFRFWGFMESSDSIIVLCVLFFRLLLRNHILSTFCLVLSWNLLPQKVLTVIELCHIGEIVVIWSGYFWFYYIYLYVMLWCKLVLWYKYCYSLSLVLVLGATEWPNTNI